jgi:hypothetical protein
MVALKVEAQLGIEARGNQGTRTDLFQKFEKSEPIHAAKKAAKITGTNTQYVNDAKKIVEQAPELKEAVMSGTLTIPDAKQVAKLPEPQRSPEPQASERVSCDTNGHVSVTEASVCPVVGRFTRRRVKCSQTD